MRLLFELVRVEHRFDMLFLSLDRITDEITERDFIDFNMQDFVLTEDNIDQVIAAYDLEVSEKLSFNARKRTFVDKYFKLLVTTRDEFQEFIEKRFSNPEEQYMHLTTNAMFIDWRKINTFEEYEAFVRMVEESAKEMKFLPQEEKEQTYRELIGNVAGVYLTERYHAFQQMSERTSRFAKSASEFVFESGALKDWKRANDDIYAFLLELIWSNQPTFEEESKLNEQGLGIDRYSDAKPLGEICIPFVLVEPVFTFNEKMFNERMSTWPFDTIRFPLPNDPEHFLCFDIFQLVSYLTDQPVAERTLRHYEILIRKFRAFRNGSYGDEIPLFPSESPLWKSSRLKALRFKLPERSKTFTQDELDYIGACLEQSYKIERVIQHFVTKNKLNELETESLRLRFANYVTLIKPQAVSSWIPSLLINFKDRILGWANRTAFHALFVMLMFGFIRTMICFLVYLVRFWVWTGDPKDWELICSWSTKSLVGQVALNLFELAVRGWDSKFASRTFLEWTIQTMKWIAVSAVDFLKNAGFFRTFAALGVFMYFGFSVVPMLLGCLSLIVSIFSSTVQTTILLALVPIAVEIATTLISRSFPDPRVIVGMEIFRFLFLFVWSFVMPTSSNLILKDLVRLIMYVLNTSFFAMVGGPSAIHAVSAVDYNQQTITFLFQSESFKILFPVWRQIQTAARFLISKRDNLAANVLNLLSQHVHGGKMTTLGEKINNFLGFLFNKTVGKRIEQTDFGQLYSSITGEGTEFQVAFQKDVVPPVLDYDIITTSTPQTEVMKEMLGDIKNLDVISLFAGLASGDVVSISQIMTFVLLVFICYAVYYRILPRGLSGAKLVHMYTTTSMVLISIIQASQCLWPNQQKTREQLAEEVDIYNSQISRVDSSVDGIIRPFWLQLWSSGGNLNAVNISKDPV